MDPKDALCPGTSRNNPLDPEGLARSRFILPNSEDSQEGLRELRPSLNRPDSSTALAISRTCISDRRRRQDVKGKTVSDRSVIAGENSPSKRPSEGPRNDLRDPTGEPVHQQYPLISEASFNFGPYPLSAYISANLRSDFTGGIRWIFLRVGQTGQSGVLKDYQQLLRNRHCHSPV